MHIFIFSIIFNIQELLSSTLALFFKRPGEVQIILGNLFSSVLSDTSSADLRDKALLYYRLLRTNMNVARNMVTVTPTSKMPHKFNEDRIILLQELFSELDSLSIAYRQPASMFISEENYFEEKIIDPAADPFANAGETRRLTTTTHSDDFDSFLSQNNSVSDDLLSLNVPSSAPVVADTSVSLNLRSNKTLEPAVFQK